jgi:hypothetical protein
VGDCSNFVFLLLLFYHECLKFFMTCRSTWESGGDGILLWEAGGAGTIAALQLFEFDPTGPFTNLSVLVGSLSHRCRPNRPTCTSSAIGPV